MIVTTIGFTLDSAICLQQSSRAAGVGSHIRPEKMLMLHMFCTELLGCDLAFRPKDLAK